MMPFTRSISQAAARYGEQATNIAQTATANISNILMGIAQIRAQGIQEGSRAWATALQQLGVNAQNWPIIKAQMEERSYQRNVGRPMQEAIWQATLGREQAQTAELISQANERNAKAQAYSSWLKWRTLPPEKRGELPPEAANFEAAFQDSSNKARANLATADKAEYDRAIAKWDTAHKIASASITRLESYPKGTDETTLRADIADTFKRIRKEIPGVLPEGLIPQPDWFTLSHLKIFAESAGERAGVKREPAPAPKEIGDWYELVSRTMGNQKSQGGWTSQKKNLGKLGAPESILAAVPDEFSPEALATVKDLGAEKATTAGIQEYNYAVSQGFKGTFEDWEKTSGASLSTSEEDVKETARAIAEGQAVPTLSQYSFRDRTALAAELRRLGYNQAEAERDWRAVNRHLSSLNGPQQLRLRQAITFAYDSLDLIENYFDEWKKTGLPGGFRVWNKAALAAAKNLPGEAGATAQILDATINDLVAELAVVYRGGNASTDEAMKLAAQNLGATWNEEQFKKATEMLRKTLQIRQNSINTSEAQGVTPGTPFAPKQEISGSGGIEDWERGPDGRLRPKQ